MSNKYNDILMEDLWEKANDIVDGMINGGELEEEMRDSTVKEIYQSLYEERDFSIEDQMDDDSGDEMEEEQ